MPCSSLRIHARYQQSSRNLWGLLVSMSGWPISDCTSEGLKAALMVRKHRLLTGSGKYIPDDRLYDAVNIILSYQNKDGGWATYENTRAGAWFEILNPSEVSCLLGQLWRRWQCVWTCRCWMYVW